MGEAEDASDRVIAALDASSVAYRIVRTGPASSAEESASLQGIPLAQLLKTIVVRKGDGDYVFVLVPADRQIDWKKLRASLGVSRASLPAREDAEALTGYRIGTISPLGARTPMPVVIDKSALGHDVVALGAGARGVNIHLSPRDLVGRLAAVPADVTVARRARPLGDVP